MNRKKERSIKKESFIQGIIALMFSQVIIKLLGLVYKLYLTNKEGFGDAGNAIYGSGYQIYALLLALSSIGVPSAISKLISERVAIGDNKGAHRIFKVSLLTFGLIGLFGSSVLFFGAKYISNVMLEIPEAELTLVALSPAIFFVSIASIIRGYFNGRENMKATANSQTIEQVFKTCLTVILVETIFIISGGNTTLMAAGATVATTLATFISFGYLYLYYKSLRKQVWLEVNSSTIHKKEKIKRIIPQILLVSVPITITALLSTINKNIDAFTVVRGLKTFISDEQRAKELYGILSGKVDTLTTLPLSFNIAFSTALVPAVSSAIAMGRRNIAAKKISFTLLATILLALPCTIGMIVFAEPILKLLFPMQSQGTVVLQIVSLTIISIALIQTVNSALQGMGKIVIPAVSLLIGVVAKLICNLVLVPIPSIGINGAAIGSVVCYVIADIISITVLCKNIKLEISYNKFVVKPLLASIMMIVVSYALYINLVGNISSKLATIISLAVAVVIYVMSVILLKILNKEEIIMLPFGEKIFSCLKKLRIYK